MEKNSDLDTVPYEAFFYLGGGAENEGQRPELNAAGARLEGGNFKFKVSEMPFPGLWKRFDRILIVRKQRYNMSKFTICLEFSITTVNGWRRI